MTMENFAVSVVPGSGIVARWEAGIAVAGGSPDAAPTVIAELQAALGARPTSGRLIELLRSDGRFAGADVDLAVAVSTPDGVRVFVRGAMQARTETNELIAGSAPIERDLSNASALWMGSIDPPSVQGHPAMDLRLGVVPGGGAVIYRTSVLGSGSDAFAGEESPEATTGEHRMPGPGASPGPGPGPGVGSGLASGGIEPPRPPSSPPASATVEPEVGVRPFQAVDWGDAAAVETRQPLEVLDRDDVQVSSEAPTDDGRQVLGINCSRGHFNNPKAGYCQVCGISMVHLTHRLEPGVRPTLGFVVFADGATYALDRPYLIGRNPQPSMDSGMTPLATQDTTQSVSREHARLEFDGWDVVYVDLGSTNGSFFWDVTAGRWNPIAPNTPMALSSGSTVSVGRMTFVFEGASRAVEAR